MTVAMKAISMSDAPIWMSTVPVWVARISPVAAASIPLSANAIMITRFARTPSMRAIVKFSAAARISSPKRLRLRKNVSAASIPSVIETVTICSSGMRAPRNTTGSLRLGHRSIDFGRLE
jgi:hypothetical protein